MHRLNTETKVVSTCRGCMIQVLWCRWNRRSRRRRSLERLLANIKIRHWHGAIILGLFFSPWFELYEEKLSAYRLYSISPMALACDVRASALLTMDHALGELRSRHLSQRPCRCGASRFANPLPGYNHWSNPIRTARENESLCLGEKAGSRMLILQCLLFFLRSPPKSLLPALSLDSLFLHSPRRQRMSTRAECRELFTSGCFARSDGASRCCGFFSDVLEKSFFFRASSFS
jgi:hypothetical protein